MRLATILITALAPLAAQLGAQPLHVPPSLERLADKASDVVDVSLDGALLKLACRFLSDRDADETKVKKLCTSLQGIYVKSYSFDRRGEYENSDVEALRSMFRGPGWTRIVGVRSKRDGDNADIFIKSDGDKIAGIGVLAAESKELTVVSVVGNVTPEDIRDLGGHFGIPRLDRFEFGKERKDRKEDREP